MNSQEPKYKTVPNKILKLGINLTAEHHGRQDKEKNYGLYLYFF